MEEYTLTWLTRNLAVGHAPMSYEELESIQEQGIDAIVNLCGEYSDLHEIEINAGFDVFWLPIPDEHAPKMEEMEEGLAWLDEAIYLGKKVLVHCNHGIGRTGTFVTAYLLRRGFDLKKAAKMLKAAETRANPSNFCQWWLLRKFGKKEGKLTMTEPTPENRQALDLSSYYSRYEELLDRVNRLAARQQPGCSPESSYRICSESFQLELIEALYLNNRINISLPGTLRSTIMDRAADIGNMVEAGRESEESATHSCPLYHNKNCLLHHFHPISYQLRSLDDTAQDHNEEIASIHKALNQLSRDVCKNLFGVDTEQPPLVSVPDAVTGKFFQRYFSYLAALKHRQ